MEIKQQNKILVITVIILLIANLATISTVWFTKNQIQKNDKTELKNDNKRKQGQRQRRSVNDAFRQLNLNDEQALIIKHHRQNHFKSIRSIKDSIRTTKRAIHTELFKEKPDTAYIFEKAELIGKFNAHLEQLNYEHFMQLKDKLNEEQRARLKQLMDEASDRGHRQDRNNYHKRCPKQKE